MYQTKANFYKFESAERDMQKSRGWIIAIVLVLVLAGIFIARGSKYTGGVITGSVVTGNIVEGTLGCGTYASATPTNAQASSVLSGNFDAAKAIDSNPETRWMGNNSSGYPQWIYFDLGAKKCVNGLDINVFNFTTPLTMDVQTSDDGQNWITVAGNWQVTQEHVSVNKPFSETHTRYVRLYQTAGPVGTSGTVSEVSVNSAPEVMLPPVTPSCTETDNGNAPDKAGITNITNSSGTTLVADKCTDGTHLQEFYCSDTALGMELVTCTGTCTNGACTTTTAAEASQTQSQPGTSEGVETPREGIVTSERETSSRCGTYESVTPRDAVSSSQFHNFRAVNAIDNDVNTHWFGDPKLSYPKWIYFDLGTKKCVDAVDANVFLWDAPLTLDIETSDDGQSWQSLISGWTIDEGGKFSRREFSEVQTRYLRLVETSGKRAYGTVSEVTINAAPIEEKVTEKAKLFTQNIIGEAEPEKFYVINGQNAYVEIDGKPVA